MCRSHLTIRTHAHMFSLRATLRTNSSNAPALRCLSHSVSPKSSHPCTMSLLGIPEFSAFPPFFSSSTTTLTETRLNPCATPPGVDRLAIWPIWLQTQIMSPSCASMSVASTWRVTRQSPPPRTSICFNIPEHRETASIRQQAQFPLCWSQVHQGPAQENCRRMTILLHVGLESTKLVRTWIVKQLFQVFSNLCLGRREIETKTLCKHWKTVTISTQSLNGKLTGRARREKLGSAQSRKLRQTWRWNIG